MSVQIDQISVVAIHSVVILTVLSHAIVTRDMQVRRAVRVQVSLLWAVINRSYFFAMTML